MVPQTIAERPLNKTNVLTNFKSFIQQVYEKHWTQNFNKKKDQNNYFRAEISLKDKQLLALKVK